IVNVSRVARAFARGEHAVRAAVSGPRELAQLGVDMNFMLETTNERAEALEAEVRERRRIADALERTLQAERELRDQLQHQAFHDPLTGLSNRARFVDRLDHALARRINAGAGPSVLFLDLDDFKSVNDTLGHAAGDDLLRQVGDRLQQCLRPADTLARMGGDEFAALIEDAPEEDALVVAERVLDALRSPFTISDREIFSRASVGAVHAGGVANSADLLKHADVAMYVAKSQGKSRVVAYRGEMEEALLDELALENDMQRALERQEFAVQYQPVVGVSDQELSGFEALLRWHHPTRGVIEPESFIYIAERTGMIIPIGEWVLGEACRTLARLQEHHPQEPPLTMAINVSAKQLSQADFRDVVERALKDAGVPANTVILEITESTMMADGTRTIAYLEALHNLGVRLAVDDFGTGYSSLSYLRKFPLDELKVDKSFIDDLVDSGKEEHVVQSIIGLAKALHLKIVAEGVENNEQLAILRAFDCDEAQGFLFSTPVDIDDAERLLTEGAMDGRAAA
ncbi:MAG TPA: EAL domain-containing protein, partial [Dehalococcoidia bacterium]|nr:EAL domain-containing protein [Dehalococcoidia bacterium]